MLLGHFGPSSGEQGLDGFVISGVLCLLLVHFGLSSGVQGIDAFVNLGLVCMLLRHFGLSLGVQGSAPSRIPTASKYSGAINV